MRYFDVPDARGVVVIVHGGGEHSVDTIGSLRSGITTALIAYWGTCQVKESRVESEDILIRSDNT